MQRYQTIDVSVNDTVASVELNRPDNGNSLNADMWRELKTIFVELDTMPEVRVVILSGRGKHFSTGIDLTYLASIQQKIRGMADGHKQEHLRKVIFDLQESVTAIERCCKPVLAVVQGFCLGAGVDIIAACDMRYATPATRFCVKEIDLAIVADLGSLQRLPGIVGQGVARELAFTGRIFKGQEALSMGFVNRLFPKTADMADGIMALAAELSAKSPLTLRGVKETLNFSRDHTIGEGLEYVAQRNAAMLLSRDLKEAMTAFMEKRKPNFED